MKDKFEKALFKEAKKISIPNSYESICSTLGLDNPNTHRSFMHKPKLAILTSVISLGVIASIAVPTALHLTNESYSESIVSLTISTSSIKKSKSYTTEESANDDTSSTTFSFFLDKDLSLNEENAFALDKNSNILSSSLTFESKDFGNYIYGLLDSAIHAGFVNANATSASQNTFSLTVSASDKKTKNKVKELIGSSIIKALSENLIYGELIDGSVLANEQMTSLASDYNVEIERFLIINKIHSLYEQEYSIDTLASMTDEELIGLLSSYCSYNFINSFTSDSVEKTLDELRDEYTKELEGFVKSLETTQNEIHELQRKLDRRLSYNYSYNGTSYREYVFYNYRDELIASGIQNGLDYHQMMLIPRVFVERNNAPHDEDNTKETIDDLISVLMQKVNHSKELVNEVISSLLNYRDEEKIILDNNMNSDKAKENYCYLYNKNVNDYNLDNKKDHRDDSWERDYEDFYHDEHDYWYSK